MSFASASDMQEQAARVEELASGCYGFMSRHDPNCGFVVGEDAVLVVDTRATPTLARELLAGIRSVTDRPVRTVFLSHYHAVRALGASVFTSAVVVSTEGTREWIRTRGEADFASERDRFPRLFRGVDEIAALTVPRVTFDGTLRIDLGGIEVELLGFGRAHTQGDAACWVPSRGVLYAGDLFENGCGVYAGDAYVRDWIATLSRLRPVPATVAVAGRGPVVRGRDAVLGGVKGRKLEMVMYDDASDTTQARSFALRLLNQDKVTALIGGTSTGTTMSVLPVAEDAEVPFISMAGALTIVDPVKKWVFKTPATDRIAAQRSFQQMKASGITKVGMLNGSDGYGQSGREQAKLVAKASGIDLVADETYAPSDTDMTGQLARMRSSGAQALLNCGVGAGPSIIARNVMQLGLSMPAYLSPAIASNAFITTTGPAAEGVLIPVAALLVADKLPDSDPRKKVCLEYAKAYTEATKEPPTYGGGCSYDALHLMVGAMERSIAGGKGTDPAAVRDELELTKDFAGIDGLFNMSPMDHMGLGPDAFIIATVRGGRFVPA